MKQNENEIILEALCEMNDRLRVLAKKQDSLHMDLSMTLHGLEAKINRLSSSQISKKLTFPISRESIEKEYEKAKELAVKAGKVSASYLEKALKVGDVKTAILMKMLEERGVIGPAKGTSPQEVLKPSDEFSRKLGARYAKTAHLLDALKEKAITPIKKRKG